MQYRMPKCNTESLLTLYDIFSRRGFPAEITEREKTAEITENFLKKLCVLRGLFFSVISVGNKMREYFQKRFGIKRV